MSNGYKISCDLIDLHRAVRTDATGQIHRGSPGATRCIHHGAFISAFAAGELSVSTAARLRGLARKNDGPKSSAQSRDARARRNSRRGWHPPFREDPHSTTRKCPNLEMGGLVRRGPAVLSIRRLPDPKQDRAYRIHFSCSPSIRMVHRARSNATRTQLDDGRRLATSPTRHFVSPGLPGKPGKLAMVPTGSDWKLRRSCRQS